MNAASYHTQISWNETGPAGEPAGPAGELMALPAN